MDNNTFNAGAFGVMATAVSLGVSILSEVEQWLRIASLCSGILVAIGSLAVIVKNWNKIK